MSNLQLAAREPIGPAGQGIAMDWAPVGILLTALGLIIAVLSYARSRAIGRRRELAEAKGEVRRRVTEGIFSHAEIWFKQIEREGERFCTNPEDYKKALIVHMCTGELGSDFSFELHQLKLSKSGLSDRLERGLVEIIPELSYSRPFPLDSKNAMTTATMTGLTLGTIVPGVGHIVGSVVGALAGLGWHRVRSGAINQSLRKDVVDWCNASKAAMRRELGSFL